mgnify:FL=1
MPSLNEAKAETETLITLEDIVMDNKKLLEEIVKRNIRTLDIIYTKVDRSKMSVLDYATYNDWCISASYLVQNFSILADMNQRILDYLYPETDRANPTHLKVHHDGKGKCWIDDVR